MDSTFLLIFFFIFRFKSSLCSAYLMNWIWLDFFSVQKEKKSRLVHLKYIFGQRCRNPICPQLAVNHLMTIKSKKSRSRNDFWGKKELWLLVFISNIQIIIHQIGFFFLYFIIIFQPRSQSNVNLHNKPLILNSKWLIKYIFLIN